MSSEQDNAERTPETAPKQDPAAAATSEHIHIAEQVAHGHVPEATDGTSEVSAPASQQENQDAQETRGNPAGAAAATTESSQDPQAVEQTEESGPGRDTAGDTGSEATTTPESAGDDDEQDSFAAFGGVSLMFHAPDPDEIRRAAEEQAARQREASQQRGTEGTGEDDDEQVTSRRRRRRRRGDADMELVDEEDGTVTKVRAPRGVSEGAGSGEVVGLKGSTRLEAKRQRRRESRQFGRRRHVITEAEFLARREAVERTMLVRQKENRIQIGVLEDGILAEHFVSHTQQDSLIGNVYVGKVQNVLPSMEAAFVDIGRGRNAVLYAGEVDWDAAELGNKPRKIENALKSGDPVLVQVTKDPVGHKGARLTSQVSLPGRYLVYVPGGSMTGISRKLPDVERQRLKKILKDRLPEGAGVIVRTAAEGASEEELTNDINRLRSQWEQIQEKSGSTKTVAPEMLYAEPDLTIKTVRDVFNEDFTAMVVQGEQAWDNIEAYVTYVAPDLLDRLQKWTDEQDVFDHFRVEEQIQKALDRKVYLPSGGSLVFDRTEAMTVVDVNTGKFTGSGGNLEETVTKNNLEAAEEIVRQLRLRDIGGIIVVDFIDMVLESNRELVLRRLVECLGRDRTKHQVAEVTSLGLVQMTRKRMGTGLLEVFSEACEACAGRGLVVHDHPLKGRAGGSGSEHRSNRNERKRSRSGKQNQGHGSHQQDNGGKDKQDSGSGQDEQSKARAEATRNALASIAAASHHDESTEDSGSGRSSDHATSQDSGGAGGRGSDGHGEDEQGQENGRRRKKRRGKRSRGRGQGGNGEQQSQGSGQHGERSERGDRSDRGEQDGSRQPEQGDQPSLRIHGEVIELPQGGSEDRAQETSGQQSLTLDSLTAAFQDDAPQQQEQPAQTGRGGRSRSRRADAQGGARRASDERPADQAPSARPARRRSRRATAPAGPGTAGVSTQEVTSDRSTAARFTAEATVSAPASTGSAPAIVGVGVKAQDMRMVGRSQD